MKDFLPWLKAFALLVSGIGIFFVLFQDVANLLADSFNVDRGADLILYLFMMIMFFCNISVYQKIKKKEREHTVLLRDKAKTEGVKLGNITSLQSSYKKI